MQIATCWECEEIREVDMLGRCHSCYQKLAKGIRLQSVLDTLAPKLLQEMMKKYAEAK